MGMHAQYAKISCGDHYSHFTEQLSIWTSLYIQLKTATTAKRSELPIEFGHTKVFSTIAATSSRPKWPQVCRRPLCDHLRPLYDHNKMYLAKRS